MNTKNNNCRMKRLYDFCIILLVVALGCITWLSACAELERRDAAELQAMMRKHRAEELARIYGELNERGCYMTSCDKIVKK